MAKIFIIEGITNTGKTTICEHFKTLNYKTLHFPTEDLNEKKPIEYFLKDMQKELKHIINTEDIIIMDRWWPSVVVHNITTTTFGNLISHAKLLHNMLPEATYILIDPTSETWLKKLKKNKQKFNKFIASIGEHEDIYSFEGTYIIEKYRQLAQTFNWKKVNGDKKLKDIMKEIETIIKEKEEDQ